MVKNLYCLESLTFIKTGIGCPIKIIERGCKVVIKSNKKL